MENKARDEKDLWYRFKQWLIDYRFKAIGSHKDGRYCVAISVTDLLAKMVEMEEEMKERG